MGRLFGTDGVRGIAITELTCELAMQIGRALAHIMRSKAERPAIIVGKDTRSSSDVLEAALCAGICSVGLDAWLIGVLPTPAVAYLVQESGSCAGVMISASHNSVEFNGIKLFAADGRKLSDEMEAEIESLILERPEELRVAAGTAVGRLRRFQNAAEMYVTHLAELIPTRLDGMRIAIDCANGSASPVAESFFHRLGAEVEVIHAAPDGCNINAGCGSTHIDGLMQHVTEGKFDAGLAFDGDADRCLAVDETGDLVDGDKMIAIMAKAYKDAGKLNNNTVVVTVMSNLGFTQFAKQEGIRRITSNVGDRYVIDTMMLGGYNLGGEQNGHLFFLDDVTTGDGLLSGAKLLEVMRNSGQKMSELASIMKRYPQVMINVRIPHYQRENWKNDGVITQLIDQYEQELGSEGRILVRESGTEPLIRVMIEGSDFKRINVIAMEIAELIRQRICK